jgi:hypothetical protein
VDPTRHPHSSARPLSSRRRRLASPAPAPKTSRLRRVDANGSGTRRNYQSHLGVESPRHRFKSLPKAGAGQSASHPEAERHPARRRTTEQRRGGDAQNREETTRSKAEDGGDEQRGRGRGAADGRAAHAPGMHGRVPPPLRPTPDPLRPPPPRLSATPSVLRFQRTFTRPPSPPQASYSTSFC